MQLESSYIILKDIKFHAFHGVDPQEQKVGNTFYVSLKIGIDLQEAATTDNLNDTISYADVYQKIKEEMETPSRLLEHVCGRIARRLFKDFPTISSLTIRLGKQNPPMGADIDRAEVEMNISR